MTRSDRRDQAQAIALAAVAGYVDATGFLALGGFFLSFMSGNSTRLAVALSAGVGHAGVAAGLVGTFVAGVVVGSLLGRRAGRWRRPAVLALVSALLAAAAWWGQHGAAWAAAGCAVLAMGAENAVFERDGEVSIGLTYMTGTLVKAGQGLARALTGGPRWTWLPHALLWAGFMAGAVAGAALFPVLGLPGLWVAAAASGLLGLVAVSLVPARRRADAHG